MVHYQKIYASEADFSLVLFLWLGFQELQDRVAEATGYNEEMIKIRKEIVDFHGEMVLLENYSALNYTGKLLRFPLLFYFYFIYIYIYILMAFRNSQSSSNKGYDVTLPLMNRNDIYRCNNNGEGVRPPGIYLQVSIFSYK